MSAPQNDTAIIQFSTAASLATRSDLSADAWRTHTRNAAAISLKSAYPLSAGSSYAKPASNPYGDCPWYDPGWRDDPGYDGVEYPKVEPPY